MDSRTRLLERSFTVRVPLSAAWEHLERVERWPSWARHIRRVDLHPSGPLTPGSEGAMLLAFGVRSTFRMEDFHPGVSWAWAGSFLWLSIYYDHRFRRVGPRKSEVRFIVDAEGVGVGLFGRLFAFVYSRNLDRAIPILVKQIEDRVIDDE